MFKIKLDEELSYKLRNAINDNQDISIKKEFNNKNAWNIICAVMDRIDDLVYYLNNKELKKDFNNAFDFIEFINASSVLIDCIDRIGKVYGTKFNELSTNIFKEKYINEDIRDCYKKEGILDEKENDTQYFKYLRSLSSVHPVKTNNHQIYMSDDLEVSPYVVWNNGLIHDLDKGEIIVLVYNETDDYKYIFVKMNEVFDFIKARYEFITEIVKKIESYNKELIDILKTKVIKSPMEFENYNDYLNNLILESENRCPSITSDIIDVKEQINITITNPRNNKHYERYVEALKYAMTFIHKALQDMDFKFTEDNEQLLFDLLNPSKTYTKKDYHYNLEKIIYLKGEYGVPLFGKMKFKEMLPLFNQYIVITEDEIENDIHDYELFVLSRVALYMNSLNNDSIVNKIIPETNVYRNI